MYRFDANRLDLAREYKARPFGEHSPDLQYLLNLMRTRETAGRHVLVMTRLRNGRWRGSPTTTMVRRD